MGVYDWENRLENGVWTYHMEDVWQGIQDAFADLRANVKQQYGVELTRLAGIGVSAMMHGYLPFDAQGKLLTPFRTWRNTMTGESCRGPDRTVSVQRTPALEHRSPVSGYSERRAPCQRRGLPDHAGRVCPLEADRPEGAGRRETLPACSPSTAINWIMTAAWRTCFDEKVAPLHFGWKLREILPQVLNAGEEAGTLTRRRREAAGSRPASWKRAVPLCPPEGDAGTGMAATNSVAVRTGNVSAGTSVFAMIVLEKPLSKVYPEIDMVTTPSGKPVAMVHCNNCTSDINAWADMLYGFAGAAGLEIKKGDVYTTLFNAAMKGEADCGGVMHYSYLSGEPITGMEEGRPMMVRLPDTSFSFANCARSLVYGAMVTLKLGMDILAGENVRMDSLLGHGGFFKTPGTAQKLLAGALNTPVSVMETAGEGGPWGMALLAAYRVHREKNETLEDYLTHHVFAGANSVTIEPDAEDVQGFAAYARRFEEGLSAERAAVSALKV